MKIAKKYLFSSRLCAIYTIKRYDCGHYSVRVLTGGAFQVDSTYNRLTRYQIERLLNVSCKELFLLKH